MKGLLIKDFTLFRNQKRMFMIILLAFAVLAAAGALSTAFIMGYLPFIFCMYVMSSISYDEFDNGLSFLMVLPTTRKQYVTEKYVFGICMGTLGMLLAVIVTTCIQTVKNLDAVLKQWIPECLFTVGFLILFVGIFLGIMIPIQIKFGSEKGRMVLFGIAIVSIGIGYLLSEYTEYLPLNLRKAAEILEHAKEWMLFMGLFAVTAVVLLISYGISVHIMEKKEF